MLVLDTHVWIWTADADRRIGPRTRLLLLRHEAQLRLSALSIFEVAALHACGRLRLTLPPEQWVREALDVPGVRVAEVTPSIAVDAGAIPRSALGDPIGRLLVATARQLDAVLVTADERILEYASESRAVRVHDARR